MSKGSAADFLTVAKLDVTAATLGKVLGLSERRIRELRDATVFQSSADGLYSLAEATRAYCSHMRPASGRGAAGGAAGAESLDAARIRLLEEQADAQAMKNAIQRGELIPKQDVVAGMQVAFANARARLLAIPTAAAPLVIGMTSLGAVKDKLTDLVHEACRELAETRAVPTKRTKGSNARA